MHWLASLALLAACGARSGFDLSGAAAGGGGAASSSGAGGKSSPIGTSGGSATVNGGAGNAGNTARGGSGTAGIPSAGRGGLGSSGSGGGGTGGGGSGGAACSGGPSVEVCNGIDDDCDGEIDEDLPLEVWDAPVVVRNDEGSTAPGGSIACTSCAWAWHPQLIAPQDQLGVVWYLGIYGSHEQPSGFGRRLSWELEPQATVSSLGPQYWLQMLRRGDTGTRGTLLALVQRAGSADRASFGFVGSDFKASASVPLDGCISPSAGFSVAPLLPGLMSCEQDNELRLFTIDEQQAQVVATYPRELAAGGGPMVSNGPAVAALDGAHGLVALPLEHPPGAGNLLWTQAITAAGVPLGEPGRQALDDTSAPVFDALFAVPGGFLLFGHEAFGSPAPGRFTVKLGPDGQRIGDINHYDGAYAGYDEAEVIRVGSGFVIAGTASDGIVLEQLDGAGDVVREQLYPVAAYSEVSLLFAHGHLYLAYAESPDFSIPANRILAARLSCAR